ncbi:MAG: Calx-beta domain-containing protein [Lysobacterales bacterium]
MKLRGLAVSLLLVGMEIAYAAAPRVIYPSTRVSVRPGGTSYTWTYGLADTPTQPGQTFQTAGIAHYNVIDIPNGFNYVLTRGRFEYSTDNGANWTTMPHYYPFTGTYLPVSGKIFRFVDTLPADSTTTNDIGVSWTLVGDPSQVSSAKNILPDTAPTDIASNTTLLFDDTPQNFVVATLNPADAGETLGGYWQIDSQSNANLFAITFDNTTGDNGSLRRSTAAVPAVGQSVTVTARYFDQYQTDNTGAPISGQGFAKSLTYTVIQNATADLPGFGPEFSVNTFTTNSQSVPSIARLSNGNFVVVWRSLGQDSDATSSGGIYGRIYNQQGVAQTSEFRISPLDNVSQNSPVVAPLSGGRFLVAYTDVSNGGDVYYRVVNADTTLGAVLSPHGASANSESAPRVAALSNGNVAIIWTDGTSGDVSVRVIDGATGNAAAAAYTINATTTGTQNAQDVASIGGGNFVVVWRDPANSSDILGRTGNASGPVSSEFTVAGGTGSQSNARVTGFADGSFAAATTDQNRDGDTGGQLNIYVQRFNSSGTSVVAQFRANATATGNQFSPGIIGFSDGSMLVGWQVLDQDLDNNGVFARRFSSAGAAIDANDLQVNQKRQYGQSAPVFAAGSGSDFAAAWTDSAQEGQGVNNNGIEARVHNAAVTPNLSINDVTVTEGDSGTTNANFTVSLSSPAGPGGVTFDIVTADNTAVAGGDYVGRSLSGQTIAQGASSASFVVQVNGDLRDEIDETFFVNVRNVTGANVTDSQGVGTIIDDDPEPSLSINDVSVNEFASGATNVTMNVTLSAASGKTITVNYFTTNGTALAGSDYTAVSGTLTFFPGQTLAAFTVPILGDTTPEPDETVNVNLASPTNATISDGVGVITILNDDALADLSITKTNGTLSSVPGGSTTYTIVASNAGPDPVTGATVADTFPASLSCTWTCVGAGGGTCAASGTGNINRSVNLPAGGSTTFTATCAISAAATGTLSNTATITSSATDLNAANNSATDTDTLSPTANLAITKTNGTTSSTPGGSTTYTITASNAGPSNATGATVSDTFPASLSCTWTCVGAGGGTCTASGSGNINQSVNLPAGGSVTYTASCAINAGATGTLVNTATVAAPGGVTDPTPGNNSATDSDTLAPSADLGITKTNGTISSTPGGSTTYTITASNAGPSNVSGATVGDSFPASLTCTWTCVGAGGGTCTASGSGNINQSVNLPAGGSATYTASCAIDAGATGSLSNTATVATPGGVTDPTPGNNSATDTDTLNPQADVSITKTDGQTSVNAGGSTTYTITASNAGPSSAPAATVADTFPAFCVSPTWTCTGAGGGTCTASGSGNINQSVNLPVGGSVSFSATCPINSSATGTLANTATVTAGVTDPNAGNNSATDSSTIVAVPVLSINSVGLTEGDSGSTNLQFQVTRSTTATAFDVSYATANGSATAGSDYTSTTGTLSFAANGSATQTIDVPIIGETLVEGSESFTLTLSNPTGTAQIGPSGTGTGTITDNDSAVVSFNPASVSQSEGSGPMAFTVTLSNPVQSGVTLTLNTANGTAGAADYTAISNGTVSFPANSNASQTVNVVINNDALDEDDETYSLTLSGLTATGNVSLGTATASATIQDDDATPTLTISSPSQNEGNSGSAPMNFVASLSAVSGRTVSFTAATANGSATAPGDYVALAATPFTIAAGQSSVTIPVTINGDTTFEGNESFSLNLTAISNATPGTLSGTGTIVEDDQEPTTTTITSDLPDPSVVGQSYLVTVTVTAQSTSPVGSVSISDGSASCTATLSATTAPNSSGSCSLSSTTAGAKTLTASYTASSSAYGNSSGTAGHQVNPAATTISVTGPARSRIDQPTAFSFALAVSSPGAGTPTGTVTLTSGASSCTATLPATSCSLTFSNLGSRTVSASYAGDGNFAASSSSGAGHTQTLVYAISDIAITKTDAISIYQPDELLVYTVTVRNLGPDAAAQIRVRDDIPAGLLNTVWSCDASGGAVCPVPGGVGSLDTLIPTLPVGGLLNFTFYGNAGSGQEVLNTALIELPADTTIEDPASANNSASDLNKNEYIFRYGFEDPQVNAANGSFRLPGSALRSLLGEVAIVVYRLDDARGEALRIYARQFDGRMQYALAVRNAQGQLRLGAWQNLDGDPQLSWSAASDVGGWVLSGASLR